MPVPTALIAEDEAVLRVELRARLGHLWPELHVCAEAQNGLEAVALMERHRPDVVFLDIEMPGMTGLELIRRLRESGNRTPMIILSGNARYVSKEDLAGLGNVQFMPKPFELGGLLERISVGLAMVR